MSRNFSGAVEDSTGSGQFQIVPCSGLYFFSRSIGHFQCLVSANYKLLICFNCHFQSGSCFFILISSVCKSLQCLFATLTQADESGHLFRLTCSVVLWGGRNTANKYHWHVWEVLSVYGPHCVCPRSWHLCFLGLHCSSTRLLRLSCSSRVRLCESTDGSPPGSFPPGILQVRILEWVAISFSNACMQAKSLQSCLTLCDPMDSSPPAPL